MDRRKLNNKITFVLYTHRDVALSKILLDIFNHGDIKIVVPVFRYSDEYGWEKAKELKNNFSIIDKLKLLHDFKYKNITFLFSIKKFKKILKESDVVLDRGLTFFVLKPIAKKNIALSFNRCYLNRILDVMPYYDDNQLIVCMHSDAWLDEGKSGSFMMEKHSYEYIKNNRHLFYGVDILGNNYDMLKKIENVKLKSEFGFPKNKKIVLLSFRKCVDPNWSLYSSNDEFIVSVRKNLIELKNKGYYIVSRRRVGQHDLAAYKTLNSPDIKRYDEVSDLIDQEINGVGGYPDLLYRLLYVSDLLYSADVSGISYVEAALTRCPVYMPYDQEWVDEKCINVNPAIRDMINRNLIFNRITLDNIKYYNNNIKEFVGEWYKTDVNKFKNYVLKK